MHSKHEERKPANNNPDEERVSFGVKILSDGQVIFQDPPDVVLEVIRKLYPDEPRIKEVDKVVGKLRENL
ncbi:MAG: hypothetical protein ABIG42_11885 [bacterium]